MKTTLVKKYAQLDADIKALEAKRTALKIEMIESLEKEGIDKIETTFGKITRAVRKTYSYSDKVNAMLEKVKVAKTKEEQKGIATAKESAYILFTPPKSE